MRDGRSLESPWNTASYLTRYNPVSGPRLTNLNGRTSVFDVETLPYGKQVLTVDGMQAEPDFFEVLAANGLLLPIRGMLWYNYGPGKN